MEFKVGDRVKIKEDCNVRKTYITDIEELKEEILIVSSAEGIIRLSKENGTDTGWDYRSDWLELVGEKDSKFAAFLREVACLENDNYYKQNEMLDKLINPNDYFSVDEEELIDELVEFYTNFEPKKKKKLTMAELREIVGEDFEIVEE